MLPPRSLLSLLALLTLAACDKIARPVFRSPPALPPEPWAARPPAQWPQIVLTNAATFRGHSGLTGASSFLVRNESGRVFAATANHLLGENGGVVPTVMPDQLSTALISWRMYPRTLLDHPVRITGLASSPHPRKNLDWLLLSIANDGGPLPAAPLTLRAAPVSIGDELYLVGVPYVERSRAQNVYRCRVTARGYGDRFRYDVNPPVDIRGFSGAPILDQSGHVAGVMTVWFKPRM